ncbi:SAM-dependent methyltransferase [Alienimonas californiensis]|uniref:Cyclopropane-fatty-acyl-phospholipid synthase n=1 Tax=Alienimonas californiensis TaxID=2527989 RepID=A0A517P7H2_9PLAN|nr:cyclopropane-fatty-acyl-phospholipid synthase family protein [Alienimonas californiensis]QDT15331.1 Cyclopropane-fatty-acyl-phospholipid synthase [Alienimonas californiensis]
MSRTDDKTLAAARRAIAHLRETVNVPISVELWDGSREPLGENPRPELRVALAGPGAIGALLRRPTLENAVRLYATGQIEFRGGSLLEFGDLVRRPGDKALKKVSKRTLLKAALPFLFSKAETPVQHDYRGGDDTGRDAKKRDNQDYIRFHYDLGNDFYKLFLDPRMQYSCGYFTDWNNTLEQAQHDKLDMICRKLRLKEGEKMLDIGFGWGGLVIHAAQNYGVQAHGVTLSDEQYAYTSAKVKELGLEDRITLEIKDYSKLTGTYDKISSIGMYEHVGIDNLPAYFRTLYGLLRDRGILLNHGITRGSKGNTKKFRKMRPEHKLIAKYIFPGGELDHIGNTVQQLEARRFMVHDVENWREHYALTTRKWAERLAARKDEAIGMVGPERYRLWEAYLAGVSFAFQDGSLRIFQVVASKHSAKGPSELPPTRADLYEPRPNAA